MHTLSRLCNTAKSFRTSAGTHRAIALTAALSCGLTLTACHSSDSATAPTVAHTYQFKLQTLTLPVHQGDYAIDLDGDGIVDNAFGSLVTALSSSGGIVSQDPIDASIASGQTSLLFSVATHDSALISDASLQTTIYRGMLSGSTTTIDPTVTPAVFTGTLTAHQFTSASPVTTTQPVSLSLKMPLFGSVVVIPLNGVHLQFTSAVASGSHVLLAGQIQGSIKTTDVTNVLVPGLAAGLNATISANPTGTTATTILNLFDSGCTPPAVGTAHDGTISACEVENNSIIRALLAPDLSIYDTGGAYAPSATRSPKNAMSFAIGFTAVGTTF